MLRRFVLLIFELLRPCAHLRIGKRPSVTGNQMQKRDGIFRAVARLAALGAVALIVSGLCRADGWIGSEWFAVGDGYWVEVRVTSIAGGERLEVSKFDFERGGYRASLACSDGATRGIGMAYSAHLSGRCNFTGYFSMERKQQSVSVAGKFPDMEITYDDNQLPARQATRLRFLHASDRTAFRQALQVTPGMSTHEWGSPPSAAKDVAVAPGTRVALLIGNSRYAVGALRYPPEDVQEMKAALLAVGFAPVVLLDGDQRSMKDAIQQFGARAQGAEIALFYYSGHGAQSRGENYLIPLGSRIEREADYELDGVSVSALLRQLTDATPRAGIVILDACRDNPVAGFKSATKGLARTDAPSRTMIAFATAPNTTTPDDGMYARVLARQIQQPGAELLDVFRRTAAEIMRLTGNRQEPRISELTITDSIYLAGPNSATEYRPAGDSSSPQAGSRQRAGELARPMRPPLARDVEMSAQETSDCLARQPLRFRNQCPFTVSASWCYFIGPAAGDWRLWTNAANSCQAGVQHSTDPIGPGEEFLFPQESMPYNSAGYVAGLTFVGGVKYRNSVAGAAEMTGATSPSRSRLPSATGGGASEFGTFTSPLDVALQRYQYRTTSGNLQTFELGLLPTDEFLSSEQVAQCLALHSRRFKNRCSFAITAAWCFDTGTAAGDWRNWTNASATCDASAHRLLERLPPDGELPFPSQGQPTSHDGKFEASFRFLGGIKHGH